MKSREYRLEAIRTIIREGKIQSQDELLEGLRTRGFDITQATLSRDLKYLKVGKVADGWKGYYYEVSDESGESDGEEVLVQDILRAFLSISFSRNLAVILTLPGHADSVAFAIDRLNFTEILGTIAGDDTIFAVLDENAHPRDFVENLRERVPGLRVTYEGPGK